jgi:hypothetical protein
MAEDEDVQLVGELPPPRPVAPAVSARGGCALIALPL